MLLRSESTLGCWRSPDELELLETNLLRLMAADISVGGMEL